MQISNILSDLDLLPSFTDGPMTIYNDNAVAVQWSHNTTTKGIVRYIKKISSENKSKWISSK